MIGFVTTFPILYIPVINDVVFKHTGISWEWGVVFVEGTLFFLGVELWKWCKRVYFRRAAKRAEKTGENVGNTGNMRAFSRYSTSETTDLKAEQSEQSMA